MEGLRRNFGGKSQQEFSCILIERSLFFRKFLCGAIVTAEQAEAALPLLRLLILPVRRRWLRSHRDSFAWRHDTTVVALGYEVLLLLLQFLYSEQVSLVSWKREPRLGCGESGYWHTHCTTVVDLALETLTAAYSFGIEELTLLTQVGLEILMLL
ncbi:BTB/POZ domain and ankyrin repeat-containing protein NPR5-like [Phragmites australis]|uniref:BTB/POZ domain and ankyrin repeat-containing protein NPR5-like n=1 Tax=Phragmites australis TaxID=29695 RepID=UPI002D798C14|nr:BTB/POZ domain and ankyrin repeat-containing protein NPR5-like [Phragmites australis]